MNEEQIRFLIDAKKATYAGKGAETSSCRPKSHDLVYEAGDLRYYDTYLGGRDFAGEEALWVRDVPVWRMNYAGRVTGEGFSGDFLKEALKHVPTDKPFRGPERYEQDGFTYLCDVQGDCGWFQGHERILRAGVEIYDCYFHGSSIR